MVRNKLIEFRQAVYQHGMSARQDALFDLLDALIAQGPVSSFAMLSQVEQFHRKCSSLYAAMQDGRFDEAWLRKSARPKLKTSLKRERRIRRYWIS
jgi:hypothetical protein